MKLPSCIVVENSKKFPELDYPENIISCSFSTNTLSISFCIALSRPNLLTDIPTNYDEHITSSVEVKMKSLPSTRFNTIEL